MGFVENGGLFKKDAQGRRVYFPYGSMGKGYILESDAQYFEIRNYLTRLQFFTILAVLLPIIVGYHMIVMVFVLVGWQIHHTKKIVADLQVSQEKLTAREAMSATTSNIPTFALVLLLILSFFMIGLLIFVGNFEAETGLYVVFPFLLFGSFGAGCSFLLFKRFQKPR